MDAFFVIRQRLADSRLPMLYFVLGAGTSAAVDVMRVSARRQAYLG